MFESKTLNVGKHSIYYKKGPENGPPLLLLHGVLRQGSSFTPILSHLMTRWQIYLPDFRGHGKSETSQNYRVIDYAEDAITLAQNAIGSPFCLYGHSLGAMVAAVVSAKLTDQVLGLILEDPPFETLGKRIHETHFHQFFSGVQKIVSKQKNLSEYAQALAEMTISTPTRENKLLGDVRDKTSLRFTARCLTQVDPDVLIPIVNGEWMEDFDQERILNAIQAPTLLIQADYQAGGMLTDQDVQVISNQISDCIHIKFQNTGHLIHSSETNQLLYYLHNFLDSLDTNK